MTPRISTEDELSEPAWWTITLTGGPHDGAVIRAEGYVGQCSAGMWVVGEARVDRLPGTTIYAEFEEPANIRYELIPGSEDLDALTAKFRWVPVPDGT